MLNDSYKAMLGEVGQVLKSRGFKKKGNFFIHVEPNGNLGFVSFITAFPHQQISKDDTEFTVEFNVASKKLLDRFRAHLFYSPINKPDPRDNHYCKRLGHLLPYQQDHWWTINPANYREVTSEVLDGILQKGLPLIEREITDEAICARDLENFEGGFRSNPASLLWLAYLLKDAGRLEKLDEVARYAIEQFGERSFENATIKDFLENLSSVQVS